MPVPLPLPCFAAIEFSLTSWDYVAFFGYFFGLCLIGYFAGRKKNKTAADYFLAGRSLPWYVVGSSYVAANISTEHFIGLIGAAVIYGICVATGEWSTVIAFSFLIWLFIPYLLTSKVYTAPEFLEKRFNKSMRFIFASVTLLVNVVAFMGPVIYGGALVLVELFGFDRVTAVIVIGIASGIWAIWGGLKSIALMDVLTIVVMISGGLSVTYLGLVHLGDGDGMIAGVGKMLEVNRGDVPWAADWISENVPNILQGAEAGDGYDRLLVLQPINHYSNPWTHWVFSFFYIGLWYTVINQHMIQKVLAAKDMYHARMGMVFASFLKLLLPFIVVVPGLIFFAMKPDFLMEGSFSEQSDAVNATYILMIKQLVPTFLTGVLLAALFGAIQSTVCSVLNSTSTIFTMDFYKMFFRKNATEKEEVVVGQVAGAVILAISILVGILLATVTKVNLFIWIQALYVFFAPPFSATFLLGALWRRVSGTDALVASIVTFVFAILLKVLEFKEQLLGWADVPDWLALPSWMIPFANQGMICWALCMVVCAVSAMITAPPPRENVSDDLTFNWKELRLGGGLGDHWYSSVTLWWAISLLSMIGFVVLFSIVL
ncbi:SLC5 family protein [Novipirellula artificiosorum]|uniref:Sodium/glucose cotransporter n=1 Tax=Novipirellula artificiosorum TaxID=2528016 RepID=A0A5C6DC56_9BACT|nr:sodium/solute symporter [Novipirellula artificiosorum]TWU34340.1 Sodium/glucose cotransporter [Novipirellula artificiosorum]